MKQYAILLLQGIDPETGASMEISKELDSEEQVLEVIAELLKTPDQWRVITVMHIEDFPSAMQGAESIS